MSSVFFAFFLTFFSFSLDIGARMCEKAKQYSSTHLFRFIRAFRYSILAILLCYCEKV